MGRGRAKAIQKKIARDLKYSSGGTDLERLRAELTGASDHVAAEPDDDEDDEYELPEDD
jgi:CelD/BcsL family acetyltransferase involved in cellulose biosynthesis